MNSLLIVSGIKLDTFNCILTRVLIFSLQIFVFSLLSHISALPIADDHEDEPRLTSNQLFHQLNLLLKHEIDKDTKTDSLEVGDKIKGDDGKLQVSIQTYSSSQGFPISFEPQDKEILDDKEIITLVSDFDGSSEYEIKKDSAETESEKVSTKATSEKPKTSSTTSKAEEKVSTAPEVSTSSAPTPVTSAPVTSAPVTSAPVTSAPVTKKEEISTKKSNDSSSTAPSVTSNKHEKLMKDIAEEPVILTHI
jgi:hypothetical protein